MNKATHLDIPTSVAANPCKRHIRAKRRSFEGVHLPSKLDVNVVSRLRFGLPAVGHWANLFRSSGIGVFFGALLGTGGIISSFTSFVAAKARAKPEEKFGVGIEGGTVATESANNATVCGTLVPTRTLGIPCDASSVMLLGSLLILGFVPVPSLFEQQPAMADGIFFGYPASSVFLFVAGILLTRLFVFILRTRKYYLIPTVLLVCSIGTFVLRAGGASLFLGRGVRRAGAVGRKRTPTPCSPPNAASKTIVGPTSSIGGLAAPSRLTKENETHSAKPGRLRYPRNPDCKRGFSVRAVRSRARRPLGIPPAAGTRCHPNAAARGRDTE